jgi:hypothetical protein
VLLPWRKEAQLFLRAPLADPGEALSGLARGARCRVVVSSAFARYALVPFSPAVIGREANEALAAHVFRRTHGERVDAWRIRVAPARAGHPSIACALDASLLDALAAAAQERGVTLSAIEPAFVAGFNAARRDLPSSCWLAVIEPGRLALGLLRDGQWRRLASQRLGADVDSELPFALARESLLVEAAEPAASVTDPAASLPCWTVRYDKAPFLVQPFMAQIKVAA